jgi:heme/copper-type cytochrome/quinol oxidase subunit 3
VTVTTTPHEEHAEHTHDVAHSQRLAVMLLILADAAFVFGLAFTYFYLRGLNTNGDWIAKGAHTVNPVWNWVIAVVIIASALLYYRSERLGRTGDRHALIIGTTLALGLVVVDLGLQVWRMVAMPGSVGDDAYNSVMMVLGGAHVFHLLITLFLGLSVWFRARRGLTSGAVAQHMTLVGYWWSWVAGSAFIIAIVTSVI